MGKSDERRRMVVSTLATAAKIPLARNVNEMIRRFAHENNFLQTGAFISDLDGTLMLPGHDRLCSEVSLGLAEIAALGRPVVFNTLRTPTEVQGILARSNIGTAHSFPVVALNGGLIGIIHFSPCCSSVFEELEAFTLDEHSFDEIVSALNSIPSVPNHAAVVVAYHRDGSSRPSVWHSGGTYAANCASLWNGSTRVFNSPEDLITELRTRQICMLYLLHEVHEDAGGYGASRIFTGGTMDKRLGAELISNKLGLVLDTCIGAGDSSLDTFLDVVGCGLQIGLKALHFQATHSNMMIETPVQCGTLLREFAAQYQNT